jgi:hypothetical protein
MTAKTPGVHPNCIGGNRCVCDRGIEHEHCICGDTTCQCHTAAAYHMEPVEDGSGRRFYVPQGARLVVRKAGAA